MKIHSDDSDEDNFDIAMDTAEKLSILRPALRPNIIDPMLAEVRTRCIAVLGDTLNTLYPIPGDQDKKSCETAKAGQKKPKTAPAWLQRWAPGKKAAGEPSTGDSDKNEGGEKRSGQEQPEVPTVKVKRRLIRRSSGFDKTTNTHSQRNEVRDKLIEKAKKVYLIWLSTQRKTV